MKTLLGILFCGALAIGCGDSNSPQDMGVVIRPDMTVEPSTDMTGGNPDMTPACFMNPVTNEELLNACTTAQSYDKMPFYPTKAPNGALPPLP